MPRIVVDTVVFVRALINPHSAAGRLLSRHSLDYELIMSRPIAREILEVLSRPELRRRFQPLRDLDMRAVIDLISRAEAVDPAPLPATSRDPEDDKFRAAAVAGRADYIVTEDKDLLVLERHGACQIIGVAHFLQILESGEE